jgi:hypothetical protein
LVERRLPKPKVASSSLVVRFQVRIEIDRLNRETHPIVTGWLVAGAGARRGF